jgi:plasmid maintenance system antidote protein VapI
MAAALGAPLLMLSSLLNGKAGLSGDRSLRIEKALGVKRYTLTRMGAAYEVAQTRKPEKLIRVRRIGCAA